MKQQSYRYVALTAVVALAGVAIWQAKNANSEDSANAPADQNAQQVRIAKLSPDASVAPQDRPKALSPTNVSPTNVGSPDYASATTRVAQAVDRYNSDETSLPRRPMPTASGAADPVSVGTMKPTSEQPSNPFPQVTPEATSTDGATLPQTPTTLPPISIPETEVEVTRGQDPNSSDALAATNVLRGEAPANSGGRYGAEPNQPAATPPSAPAELPAMPVSGPQEPRQLPGVGAGNNLGSAHTAPAAATPITPPVTTAAQPPVTVPPNNAFAPAVNQDNMQGAAPMARTAAATSEAYNPAGQYPPAQPNANGAVAPRSSGMPGVGRPGEQELEGRQRPALTILKSAPSEIQVGKECTFTIQVRNNGATTAHDVRLVDEVPQGTELIGTVPRAASSQGRLTWDIGPLAAGEERTVEVQLMPTAEGDIGSVATVTFSAAASVRTRATRPALEIRTAAPPKVLIGEMVAVEVEIRNPGTGDASGVMIMEAIPAGVSHPQGPNLEFEVGTLRAGETRKLSLELRAEQAGLVRNRMTAQADANLVAESTSEFEVIAPNLQTGITGPKRRYLERPATYKIAIANPGTAPANDVSLIATLPKGMKFVSANNLGEYDSAAHAVHWKLAELPANQSGEVELEMLPIQAGEQPLRATVTAALDLSAEAEQPILVEGVAAIMFEVVDVDDPIEVGGQTTYEIRVVNQGSKVAGNVRVVAQIPPGMSPVRAAGPTAFETVGNQVIFQPLARLAPKADTTFRVEVQGNQAGDQRFLVQVTTDEIQQPITKEESTRVYSDQ